MTVYVLRWLPGDDAEAIAGVYSTIGKARAARDKRVHDLNGDPNWKALDKEDLAESRNVVFAEYVITQATIDE